MKKSSKKKSSSKKSRSGAWMRLVVLDKATDDQLRAAAAHVGAEKQSTALMIAVGGIGSMTKAERALVIDALRKHGPMLCVTKNRVTPAK